MQQLYADGCFSKTYKAAGVGYLIHPDKWDLQFSGKEPLLGIKSSLEIEFMAQYNCLKRASGLLTLSDPLVLFTDCQELQKLISQKRLIPDLMAGRNFYEELEKYSNWSIELTNRKVNKHLNMCDVLSRYAMHEIRDIVRPKTYDEKVKFRKKQAQISGLVSD